MLRLLSYILILLTCTSCFHSRDAPDRLEFQTELDQVMVLRDAYERAKLEKIEGLRDDLLIARNLSSKVDILLQLIDEYKKYQIDSAIKYSLELIEVGKALKDDTVYTQGAIFLSSLYSSAGKFIESEHILQDIKRKAVPALLIPEYFKALVEFNSHYGQLSNNELYFKRSEIYRDSLLSILDSTTIDYKIAIATKYLYNNNSSKRAESILLELLDKTDDQQVERALIAYLLGVFYKSENDLQKQLTYFARSAIVDVKNVVKDNASLQSLALCYYEQGDIDKAFLFIQEAINDANFSNVRYRTLENTGFYSIINSSFQKKESHQKRMLLLNLSIISFLTILLLVALFVLFIQLKKVKAMRTDLKSANLGLKELNEKLLGLNLELSESNHIKEEYIAQFFDICSNYINKLDDYRRFMLRKFATKEYDDVNKLLKSQDFIKNELDDLYRNFDVIFLNLYPSFIQDFNNLLRPEEQITLKADELLNTELRVFALIRLGITDSAKIAGFLRYSLRTVYNYRVKVRNKVEGSKDEFEKKVRIIGDLRSI